MNRTVPNASPFTIHRWRIICYRLVTHNRIWKYFGWCVLRLFFIFHSFFLFFYSVSLICIDNVYGVWLSHLAKWLIIYLSAVIIIHCHVSINMEQMLSFRFSIIMRETKCRQKWQRSNYPTLVKLTPHFPIYNNATILLFFFLLLVLIFRISKQITKQPLELWVREKKGGNFPDNVAPLCTKEKLSSFIGCPAEHTFCFSSWIDYK